MARSNRRWSGNILDGAGPGTILEPLPKKRTGPPGPVCSCPPPEANRLGGQRPMLRWISHTELAPCCGTCLKPLWPGIHKRRQAVHVMGLARLELEVLDLADLADAGLLLDEPRPPAEPDPWVEARQHPRVQMAMAAAALDPEDLAALQALAEPEDLAALARLVEAGSDFTDGAIKG
jgi:hypothetical protein